MRGRRHPRPSSLTSMIDVLFILVFAALAQRAASATSAPTSDAETSQPQPQPTAPDAGVPLAGANSAESQELRRVGVAAATATLERGESVIVRVTSEGQIVSVESVGARHDISVPLLEKVADPDIGLAYLGDRSAELQLCAVARRYVKIDGALVIIALDSSLEDLRVALVDGLERDIDRCRDLQAMAVLVERRPR